MNTNAPEPQNSQSIDELIDKFEDRSERGMPREAFEAAIQRKIIEVRIEELVKASNLFVNPYLRQDKFQAYIKERIAELEGQL